MSCSCHTGKVAGSVEQTGGDNIAASTSVTSQRLVCPHTTSNMYFLLSSDCENTLYTISHFSTRCITTILQTPIRTHLRTIGPVYFVSIVLLGIVRSSDLDARQTVKWLHSIRLQWQHVQCKRACFTLQTVPYKQYPTNHHGKRIGTQSHANANCTLSVQDPPFALVDIDVIPAINAPN